MRCVRADRAPRDGRSSPDTGWGVGYAIDWGSARPARRASTAAIHAPPSDPDVVSGASARVGRRDDVPSGTLASRIAAHQRYAPPESLSMTSVLRRSRRPASLVAALAATASKPFPIQAATLPDTPRRPRRPRPRPTGRGKTLAFALPLVARLAGVRRSPPGRPRGLVLAPTRELATQIAAAIEPLAAPLGMTVTTVFGGVSQNRRSRRCGRRRHRRRLPRPPRGPDEAAHAAPRRRRDHGARRGRPHGRPRLPARRHAPARRTPAGGQRCCSPPRWTTASTSSSSASSPTRSRTRSTTARPPSRPWRTTFRGRGRGRQERGHRGARLRRRRRILFIRTKHGAKKLAKQLDRRRHPGRRPARQPVAERPRAQPRRVHPRRASGCWSPPTSPPAASTSTTSHWSSTSTRRPSTRRTCTAPAAPPAPAPAAPSSRSCCPSSAATSPSCCGRRASRAKPEQVSADVGEGLRSLVGEVAPRRWRRRARRARPAAAATRAAEPWRSTGSGRRPRSRGWPGPSGRTGPSGWAARPSGLGPHPRRRSRLARRPRSRRPGPSGCLRQPDALVEPLTAATAD